MTFEFVQRYFCSDIIEFMIIDVFGTTQFSFVFKKEFLNHLQNT